MDTRMRRRSAGNAIDEQRMGGLGDLPEELTHERRIRGPISSAMTGAANPEDFQEGRANPFKSAVYPFIAQITSEKALPANPYRAYLLVQNNSASAIFINFGMNATATNAIQVAAGGNLIFEGGTRGGSFVPAEDVYILGAAANLACVVMEGMTAIEPVKEKVGFGYQFGPVPSANERLWWLVPVPGGLFQRRLVNGAPPPGSLPAPN